MGRNPNAALQSALDWVITVATTAAAAYLAQLSVCCAVPELGVARTIEAVLVVVAVALTHASERRDARERARVLALPGRELAGVDGIRIRLGWQLTRLIVVTPLLATFIASHRHLEKASDLVPVRGVVASTEYIGRKPRRIVATVRTGPETGDTVRYSLDYVWGDWEELVATGRGLSPGDSVGILTDPRQHGAYRHAWQFVQGVDTLLHLNARLAEDRDVGAVYPILLTLVTAPLALYLIGAGLAALVTSARAARSMRATTPTHSVEG